MSDYTPTTEDVRVAYSTRNAPAHDTARKAAFDRWLDERDREVAARAWDAGYHSGELTPNPYREGS